MSTSAIKKELYTKKQLAELYQLRKDTVFKILNYSSVSPDGKVVRYPGYYSDTFESAKKKYYDNFSIQAEEQEDQPESDLDERTRIAKLRINEAKAEEAELSIAERKNSLVSRILAEQFLYFVVSLFTEKIRELTRSMDNDELYNVYVEDCYAEIEAYINEKGFGYMVDEQAQQKVKEILEDIQNDEESSNTTTAEPEFAI